MFSLYLIICQTNGKPYVGQTARPLDIRFQEHINQANRGKTTCRKLYAAIRKYGDNNFSVKMLVNATTQEEADRLEIAYIKELNSIANGYNLQIGGYNGRPSEETRKLMSEQRLGEKNGMYGRQHSQAAKDSMSAKRKGQPSYWKGKSIPQEVRDKVSASRIGKTVGENNPGAKLTLIQVEEIRILLNDSDLTQKEIAIKFGVSRATIQRIGAGTHWK